jgi:hypothetical protein
MRAMMLLLVTGTLAGCAHESFVGATETTSVYAEQPALLFERVPLEEVTGWTREALAAHGFVVVRITRSGYDRIVWARHGHDELVRIFLTPEGRRIAVRGVRYLREGKGTEWTRREPPVAVIRDLDRHAHR